MVGRVLVVWLCMATSAVSAASGESAGGSLPKPDILDMFGRGPATATTEPAMAEQDREIKRAERVNGSAGAIEQQPLRRRGSEPRGWSIRDALPLAAVLGVIVVIALILRRFMPGRGLLGGSGGIHLLARMPLSPKQHVVLLRLGRRLLLVGVSPENMNTLCVVDDPEQVALLMGEIASSQPASITREFEKTFADETVAYVDPADSPDVAASGQVRGLLEKVRRLRGNRGVA